MPHHYAVHRSTARSTRGSAWQRRLTRAPELPSRAVSYRPDIDGLRAVAVLSVLAFHLGSALVPRGYLGVDIFFVISGFLLTGSLGEQMRSGNFSFRSFYLRRARRLLPALLVTAYLSLLAAGFLLSPKLLEELGGSAVAAVVSLSNYYFYRQSDYFDTSAILKPLLHTWSLGVEEQFYLAWPLLLLGCRRFLASRMTLFLVIGVGLASYAWALYWASDPPAAFYLTPCRLYEFALGGVLVWTRAYRASHRPISELGLIAGLAIVVLSISGAPLPPLSLGPVASLGAGLILQFGDARHVGLLLRNRLATGLGVISYSLYLVHWPLIVFVRYRKFQELSSLETWLIAGFAVLGGALLYRFVEQPVRRGRGGKAVGTDRAFLLLSAAASAALVCVSADMLTSDGWLWRYPAAIRQQIRPSQLRRYEDYTWATITSFKHDFRRDGRPRVLVIGDSQAADFLNMLQETGQLDRYEISAAPVGRKCQALIAFDAARFAALRATEQKNCDEYAKALLKSDKAAQADVVLLSFNWDEEAAQSLPIAIRKLREQGVKKIIVVGSKAQGYSGADVVLRYGLAKGLQSFSAAHKNPSAWSVNAELAKLGSDVEYVDLMAAICPSPNECRVLTHAQDIIFFDALHFTPAGASYIGGLLLEAGALTL